jgi:cobalt-zinc-cadmium efflux system membrane fusion protein
MSRATVCLPMVLLMACNSGVAPTPHASASEVTHPIAESELPTVQLAPEAIARLHIETTSVREASVPRTRLVGGEVVVPPGRTVAVTAPVAGEVHFITPLLPGSALLQGAALLRITALAPSDRDTRARVVREVDAAEANLAALELRVTRNQLLVDQRAGATRALEEAIAARDVAQADLAAARGRAATLSHHPLLSDVAMVVRAPTGGVLRALSVGEGQAVAAGAPLLEVADVESLQVRVPVYAGDLGRLESHAPAHVHRTGEVRFVEAHFIQGPPTAEPDRSTVDRYLALAPDAGFEPGERILVELPLREQANALLIPASAVVIDAWGGAWVYRCEAERFTRARVDPLRRVADDMVLAHGPLVGSCVVSVGAVELFGTEFPPGH